MSCQNFGTLPRPLKVTKGISKPSWWEQTLTAVADAGTFQILLPVGVKMSGSFKVKLRFYELVAGEFIEKKDIGYTINATGLVTIFLPTADIDGVPVPSFFTGKVYITQR